MTETDIRNNPLSGANNEQAKRYDQLIQEYVEYRASVFKELKTLCSDAPAFAMAHLFKGYLLLSMGTQATVGAALDCARQVTESGIDLTAGEKHHVDALTAWAAGNTEQAVAIWEEILVDAPLDLLAMKLHHFALFWLGKAEILLKICKKLSPAWSSDVPGQAHFLGMLAFAEEEQGQYGLAEEHANRAFAESPDDLWAMHALAHIYEMQGRVDDGIDLLDIPIDRFADRNPFRGHLWWHLGMFLVEKGDFERALQVYDAGIYSEQSSFYLDMQNTASILARLDYCGINTGDRWRDLLDAVKERSGDHVLAFTEPHHTMILARCGHFDDIESQLDSLSSLANDTEKSIGRLIDPLVLPLCKAARDYYKNSFESAASGIASLQPVLQSVGGSHAQRDLFSLMEIQSHIEGHDHETAESMLATRLANRPNSALNWLQYARVNEALGNQTKVEQARSALSRIAAAS